MSAAKKKASKRSSRKKAPKVSFRYTAAKNSGFTDEDAAIIGGVLERIATENAVDGIRSLDKDLVLDEYESGTCPELTPYLEQDKDEAQRQYWRSQIGTMIRSIRVATVSVELGSRAAPRPQFVTCKNRRGHGVAPVRSRVMTDDVMASDPLFASAYSLQVKIVSNAVKKLEHLVAMKQNSPAHMKALPEGLRATLDSYLSDVLEEAAE